MLLLSLALVLIPSSVADARRVPTCTKKGGKTLLATKAARVFQKGGRVYACLYRIGGRPGRRVLLGDGSVGNLRLAGRFVGYRRLRDGSGYRVTVKNLRSGKIAHDAPVATPGRPALDAVTDLVLKHTGGVAWIAKSTPLDGIPVPPYFMPLSAGPSYEVQRGDRRGMRVLDRGPNISPGSLKLRRSTLSWIKGGRAYSAVLY